MSDHVPILCSLFRIIEPLASRCSKFRFRPLDNISTSLRLKQIADAEKVPLSSQVITTLIDVSNGDLRRAVTYLQSASRLSSASDPPTEISTSDIQEIAGVVPDSVINAFARVLGVDAEGASVGDKRNKGFASVRGAVKNLMREGYSASQILSQVS